MVPRTKKGRFKMIKGNNENEECFWIVKLSVATNNFVKDNHEVFFKIPNRSLDSSLFFIITSSYNGVFAKSCLTVDYSFEFLAMTEYEKVIKHFKLCMYETIKKEV